MPNVLGKITAAGNFKIADADEIAVDASGFGTNLATTDDDLQKVANKIDALSVSGSGAVDSVTGADGGGLTVAPTTGAVVVGLDQPTKNKIDKGANAGQTVTARLQIQSAQDPSDSDIRGVSYDPAVGAAFGSATPRTFTVSGETYTLYELIELSSGRVEMIVFPRFTDAEIAAGSFILNGASYDYANANSHGTDPDANSGNNSRFVWTNQPSRFTATESFVLEMQEPIEDALRTLPDPSELTNDTVLKVEGGEWETGRVPRNTPPAASSFPPSPTDGQEVTLTVPTNVAQTGLLSVAGLADGGEGWAGGDGGITPSAPSDRNLVGIYYYPSGAPTVAAALQDHLVVQISGAPTPHTRPFRIDVANASGTLVQYPLTVAPISGNHFYRASADADGNDVSLNTLALGDDQAFQIIYEDGTKLYPDRHYEPAPYAYSEANEEWELLPTSAANWALAGNTDKIPVSKLPTAGVTEIQDGAGSGINITDINADVHGHFVRFDPVFDLDAAANQHGVVLVEITAIVATSTANIGFGSSHEPRASFTGLTFATSLRGTTAYSDSANNGDRLGTIQVFGTRNSTHELAGVLDYRLARNTNGELGYWWRYTHTSAQQQDAANLSFNTQSEVSFVHNDSATSANSTEVLLDWSVVTTTLALTNNTLTEISGADSTFSRALTADDDNKFIHFRIGMQDPELGTDVEASKKYTDVEINAGDWRTGQNQTANTITNTDSVRDGHSYIHTTFGSPAGWGSGMLCKGANGRVAIFAENGNKRLRDIKAWLR